MTSNQHNFGKYCKNKCTHYHIVNGDSACNVTGTRLTTTRMTVIYEVGCASYDRDSHSPYQSERNKVLELLDNLRRYANGEYKEADLSDNEHDLRIHLEYENRIWGIMKELRQEGEP